MRKVDIIICNPVLSVQLTAMQQQASSYLVKYPQAKLTWLQSSASRTLKDGTTAAQHVLSCVIEYEAAAPAAPAKPALQTKSAPQRRK